MFVGGFKNTYTQTTGKVACVHVWTLKSLGHSNFKTGRRNQNHSEQNRLHAKGRHARDPSIEQKCFVTCM